MAKPISNEEVLRIVKELGKWDEFEVGWGRPLDEYLAEYAHVEDIGFRVLGDLEIDGLSARYSTAVNLARRASATSGGLIEVASLSWDVLAAEEAVNLGWLTQAENGIYAITTKGREVAASADRGESISLEYPDGRLGGDVGTDVAARVVIVDPAGPASLWEHLPRIQEAGCSDALLLAVEYSSDNNIHGQG